MMGLDLIAVIAGLVIPPISHFINKKFTDNTPENTMGALAASSPENLPMYIEALGNWINAKTAFFNRDVIGEPSLWIIDLRAAIRPVTVIFSLGILAMMVFFAAYGEGVDNDVWQGVRLFCEANVSSWMGSRISLGR